MNNNYINMKLESVKKSAGSFSAAAIGSFVMIPPAEKIAAISLEISGFCQMQCPHCIQRPRNYADIADNGDIKFFLTGFTGVSQRRFVSFAGAEPTQDMDRLVELSEEAKKVAETILMTNANFLTSANQSRLAGKIDYVDASLDGIKGTYKAAFEEGGKETMAWQNIKLAAKSGLFKKVSIIVTVMRDNLLQFSDFLEFLRKEFTGEISVGFYMGEDGDPGILSKDEFLNAVKIALASKRSLTVVVPGIYEQYMAEIGVPQYHRVVLTSQVNGALVRMDADGDLYYGCSHLPVRGDISYLSIGNIKEASPVRFFR